MDSVNIGSFEIENVTAIVADDQLRQGINGVIGLSCLRNCLVRVDLAHNKILLYVFNPSAVE